VSGSPLLELEHLRVTLPTREGTRTVLCDVSLQVAEGEAVGLVGMSGSGKTMTARAIVRLLPPGAEIGGVDSPSASPSTAISLPRSTSLSSTAIPFPRSTPLLTVSPPIRFEGRSVLDMDREQLLRYRASDVAMIFQDPRAHINPVRRIGDFLGEALVLTLGMPRAQATAKVTRLLGETGVDEPERRLRQYPHELSGGQLQRVMIAAALACEPKLLIADEPTTALDVTTQSEVMAMLDELRRARGLALLFITHDLDLAAAVCERTVTMRDGAIVEERPLARADLLQQPLTPAPASATESPVLEVCGLRKAFRVRGEDGRRADLLAVDDVSFTVPAGGSLAIVGESGSGKTTVARMIVGLQAPTAGAIAVAGNHRSRPPRGARERRARGREAQIVFQDNYSSLDPRQRIGDALGEAVDLHFRPTPEERRRRVAELLDSVGLKQEHAKALPRTLSGGERQRAALARALAVEPRLLVLDEAVSSLDVATQTQILDLLAQIRARTRTAYVFISHNLAVVRRVSDETIVLRRGRVVERGATSRILESPGDPYTRLLLDSVPRPGWKPRRPATTRPSASG
jgi:peptide/nickel transport system ATP-binding protein